MFKSFKMFKLEANNNNFRTLSFMIRHSSTLDIDHGDGRRGERESGRKATLRRSHFAIQQTRSTRHEHFRTFDGPHQAQVIATHRSGEFAVFLNVQTRGNFQNRFKNRKFRLNSTKYSIFWQIFVYLSSFELEVLEQTVELEPLCSSAGRG